MSLRTPDELSDCLSNDLAWRKRELTDLKYFIDISTPSLTRGKVLGRCGVAVLYAHWEGFVKRAGRSYLEFVAMQRLPNSNLNVSLLTLSMRHKVDFSPDTQKASEYGKFTNFFLTLLAERSSIPYKTAVNTESNLSSVVLKEIIWCLGLDYKPFEVSEKFIDSTLLGRRNHIAHGESTEADPKEYEGMRDKVIELMTILKDQIENAAVLKSYKAL